MKKTKKIIVFVGWGVAILSDESWWSYCEVEVE